MTGARQMGRRGHKILFVGRVMATAKTRLACIAHSPLALVPREMATHNRHCSILFIAFVNLVSQSVRNLFQLFNLQKFYAARY